MITLELIIIEIKNLVRSGIRTHASNGDQKPLYADAAQVLSLESGALDRSAILTTD